MGASVYRPSLGGTAWTRAGTQQRYQDGQEEHVGDLNQLLGIQTPETGSVGGSCHGSGGHGSHTSGQPDVRSPTMSLELTRRRKTLRRRDRWCSATRSGCSGSIPCGRCSTRPVPVDPAGSFSTRSLAQAIAGTPDTVVIEVSSGSSRPASLGTILPCAGAQAALRHELRATRSPPDLRRAGRHVTARGALGALSRRRRTWVRRSDRARHRQRRRASRPTSTPAVSNGGRSGSSPTFWPENVKVAVGPSPSTSTSTIWPGPTSP